jgi:hypothetical protein
MPGSASLRTVDLGFGHLQATSYLELQATLGTTGTGGIVFDENATNHYKCVVLDVASQEVLVGHFDPGRGWVVDTSVNRSLAANTDYAVGLTLNGASVSVTLNGAFALSWGFNAPVVDGGIGVLSRSGTTSFDNFRIRTNDQAFALTRLPGDANMDGEVNFQDYQVLERYFGRPGTWRDGDFNRDWAVTFTDYQLLEANFGRGGSGTAPADSSAPATGDLRVTENSAGEPSILLDVSAVPIAYPKSGQPLQHAKPGGVVPDRVARRAKPTDGPAVSAVRSPSPENVGGKRRSGRAAGNSSLTIAHPDRSPARLGEGLQDVLALVKPIRLLAL